MGDPMKIQARELTKKQKTRMLLDFIHRIMMHYGMWFGEVRRQLGSVDALNAWKTASGRGEKLILRRLAEVLGFEMADDLPKPLLDMPENKLDQLLAAMAANWLVNDGVWFQAVEFVHGMDDAKRCNDGCWGRFSPFEAYGIKQFLSLPEHPGLSDLKTALGLRLYARINAHGFYDETPDGFLYRMNECRVQAARKRKDLEDYPCKSGGLVEYTSFARAIDSRIRTRCVGCPPDHHPDDWYCAWQFYIKPPDNGKPQQSASSRK